MERVLTGIQIENLGRIEKYENSLVEKVENGSDFSDNL